MLGDTVGMSVVGNPDNIEGVSVVGKKIVCISVVGDYFGMCVVVGFIVGM